MTTLIIARHGNTFATGETPLRIGAGTDLPLVANGQEQAKRIGEWLTQQALIPDIIYSGELQRTVQTATVIATICNINIPIIKATQFNEIDYGPDEGKTENEVAQRIGIDALREWDEKTIVPSGWQADPAAIIEDWLAFGKSITKHYSNKIILVVTSNGVARFAPHLTGQFAQFKQQHAIKIATGALCILQKTADTWRITHWNLRP